MAQPTTNHPLEIYACTFEDVKHFKQKHALAATVALFACALIALIGYYLLTNNTMGVNLGPNLNIAASVAAGSTLLGIAIIGILIHYGCKISAKEAAASEEHFLKALTHPRTIALLSAVRKGKNDEWAWMRFDAMLTLNFPEENWQGMMRYFDDKFNHQPGCIYANETQNHVYNVFLYADAARFIFNYIELKVLNHLSVQCRNFLNNKLGDVYRGFTVDEWKKLVNTFDKKYADYPYFTALKQQLLYDLKKVDSNKFKEAGLEHDSPIMVVSLDSDDDDPTAKDTKGTGSGVPSLVGESDDLLISD